MELEQSNYRDERIIDVLAYNNVPKNASILNIKRDPRRTTERYTETDDVEVIQEFNRHGWSIVNYQEVKPHKTSRQGFQKYLAIYENPDFRTEGTKAKPQIIQRGSHDGTAVLQIDGGLFTFACANGLIVGDCLFEPIRVKHIGDIPLEVGRAIRKYVETVPVIFNRVQAMTQRILSPFEALTFARDAVALRFDGDKYSVEFEDVLKARRREDDNYSLWSVFNRVQENLINPADSFRMTTANNKQRKVKKITNIDTNVKLNKELWHLTDQFLQ